MKQSGWENVLQDEESNERGCLCCALYYLSSIILLPFSFNYPFSSSFLGYSCQVPPSWRSEVLPPLPGLPELTVYGTGFKEHGCPHGWCPLNKEWPATTTTPTEPLREGGEAPLGSLSTSGDGHREL
jgi:hypothetical protein